MSRDQAVALFCFASDLVEVLCIRLLSNFIPVIANFQRKNSPIVWMMPSICLFR